LADEQTEYGKGYTEAEAESLDWLRETVDEWYGLKVFDAHQTLALKELVHEYEKRIWRG
jgi:hypothetical protein